MANINSIDYSRFGNENYLSFCRETNTIIDAFPVISQRFGYLVNAFEAATEELDDAIKLPTWSELTQPIADKDDARDRVLLAFKAQVESQRHFSLVEGVSLDAEKVERFIKLNHANPAAQYDKETAQISNLLQDLERYCPAEVERMGVQPLLNELKRLNDEVAALIAERDIQDTVKKNDAVKQARRKLDKLYVALKDTVNGAALVDTEGALTLFIDSINNMLKRLEIQVLKTPTTSSGPNTGTESTPEKPNPENPNPENPEPENPNPENPNPENPNPENPNPENPDPENPEPENPNPENPEPENPGNEQEEDDPNMPPPGSGGSGFE